MKATAVAAVMALLSVANAERSLLAHKVSGGSSLHGLAITDNFYYTTNGNGSWSSQNNRGYKAAAACGGSTIGATAGPPYVTAFVSGGQYAPLSFWKLGYSVTSVSFPSRLLGVAVGSGCSSNAGYQDPDFTAWTSVGLTLFPTYVPNILTTFDQGATWQQVTGFSTKPKSFAQTVQYDNTAVPVAQKYTAVAPDLLSVHCTTRSLCFAAGGYFGSSQATGISALASPTYLDQVGTVVTAAGAIIAHSMPVAGVIVRSTNGGTYWNYITLPNIAPAQTITGPANIGPTPIPGLSDVSTDSSGRHVYAVGAPYLVLASGAPAYSYPATDGPEPFSAATTVAANAIVSGTIIYSGAYGVTNSWVVQTAPKLPNMWYGLNAVTVLRGTTAIAVGGSPFGVNVREYYGYTTAATATPPGFATPAVYTTANAAPLQPSGVIVMTFNGGFSWLQQNLPSWSYWTGASSTAVPAAYTVTNTYVTALNSSSMLPGLNDVACYATTVGTSPFYNCMAVGDYGYVVKAQYPAVTVSNTVITSTTSWVYQNVTQVSLTSGFLDVYGVTWDNNMVGYMYGYQTILSTHDGGATWIAETPNQIITATSDNALIGLATVPTTY